MTTLLTLPSEIRHQIWATVFAHRWITSQNLSAFSHHDCTPCRTKDRNPEPWNNVYPPLLTCKQIYDEGHDLLFSTLTLVLDRYETIDHLLEAKFKLLSRYRNLCLYIHLNEENRIEWAGSVLNLTVESPQLTKLTLHNHMRPPMSYEHLVDGIFFSVPLVSLPQRIYQNATLKFDYIYEDVMFASPFLGEIKCSDALEEHELVIKDLLLDEQFRAAANARDLEVMTGALLRIARGHEQPWFAKLQRRRLAELARGGQQGLGPQMQASSGPSNPSQ